MQVEAPFEAGIDAEIVWIPVRAWLTYDLLVIVDRGEWESGVPVERVDKVPVVIEYWELQGKPAAGDNPVRRIPGQRAALLRAQQRQGRDIVDSRVGVRRGMRIGDKKR